VDADVVVSAVGMTVIINLSYALACFRKKISYVKLLDKFIHCPMCVGFWCGGLLSYLNGDMVLTVVFSSFTASLCSYTWYLLMKYFIDKYD